MTFSNAANKESAKCIFSESRPEEIASRQPLTRTSRGNGFGANTSVTSLAISYAGPAETGRSHTESITLSLNKS